MTRFDPESGAHFIIAIDSTVLGPAAGGTRAAIYPSLRHALVDAQNLSRAMTLKMAVAQLPMGGGKAVICLPVPRRDVSAGRWERILGVHAENLNKLAGSYWTGPDVNTNSADMDVLSETTRYAFGRSPSKGGSGSSAASTSLGVFEAIKATIRFGRLSTLDGCRVVVQGLGAVGSGLSELLAAAGARVVVTDTDRERLLWARSQGYSVVDPLNASSTPCDIFAPCAMGGLIDRETASSLPTTAVVGAANNVLGDTDAGRVLKDRGIYYAPDFVTNAGGALHLVGREVLNWSSEEVEQSLTRIGETLTEIYEISERENETTESAAHFLAHNRLLAADLSLIARQA